MLKSRIAVPLMTVSLGAAAAWAAAQGTDMSQPGQGIHDLVLKAAGRQVVPPGSVGIPVHADGADYEVIVVAPGAPRFVHVGGR